MWGCVCLGGAGVWRDLALVWVDLSLQVSGGFCVGFGEVSGRLVGVLVRLVMASMSVIYVPQHSLLFVRVEFWCLDPTVCEIRVPVTASLGVRLVLQA